MTIHIELSELMEARLREQAAAEGTDPAVFVREAPEDKLDAAGEAEGEVRRLSPTQRVARWVAWVDRHESVAHFVDDSRASIYEGRGE